jgi:hypothetical protein
MLYETFSSIRESFEVDYFTSRLVDKEYGVSEEDKKMNKEFYKE